MSGTQPPPETIFESALLDEARHRHANEYASALATINIVRAKLSKREPLLDDAINRLEANVRLERLLLNPGNPDVGKAVLDLCSLVASSRVNKPTFHVKLTGQLLMHDLAQMRVFLMIAYEFLANAAKRSSFNSPISVRLSNRRDELRLSVVNSFDPSEAPDHHIPSGIGVLRRLAVPFGGCVHFSVDGSNYVAQARFPKFYRASA